MSPDTKGRANRFEYSRCGGKNVQIRKNKKNAGSEISIGKKNSPVLLTKFTSLVLKLNYLDCSAMISYKFKLKIISNTKVKHTVIAPSSILQLTRDSNSFFIATLLSVSNHIIYIHTHINTHKHIPIYIHTNI